MKRVLLVVAIVAIGAGAGVWWFGRGEVGATIEGPLAHARGHGRAEAGTPGRREGAKSNEETGAARRREGGELSSAEKAARIARIKRDYDEVRAKVAADYSAAGANFPGGLNAFLRQLALLEREKRADFAAFLSARELEDLEYRETTAGQLVQRLLGDTAATEEQRRAVFRRQLAFEDEFALRFDLSPAALLERETARQRVQAEIRDVLGDELFAKWLRGEGADFENFADFMRQQGLPEGRAFELWQLKNDFVRRRLELSARNLPAAQVKVLQEALTRETQARVVGILGPGATQIAQRQVLGWLPGK